MLDVTLGATTSKLAFAASKASIRGSATFPPPTARQRRFASFRKIGKRPGASSESNASSLTAIDPHQSCTPPNPRSDSNVYLVNSAPYHITKIQSLDDAHR